MCRNIKPLYNFSPVATDDEIEAAALQFVRKISGMNKPSEKNEIFFKQAVSGISKNVKSLFNSLETNSAPKNREIEYEKKKARNAKRFNV